jgi:hypothetical protein
MKTELEKCCICAALELHPDLPDAVGENVLLQQVPMNLAVNSFHSMEDTAKQTNASSGLRAAMGRCSWSSRNTAQTSPRRTALASSTDSSPRRSRASKRARGFAALSWRRTKEQSPPNAPTSAAPSSSCPPKLRKASSDAPGSGCRSLPAGLNVGLRARIAFYIMSYSPPCAGLRSPPAAAGQLNPCLDDGFFSFDAFISVWRLNGGGTMTCDRTLKKASNAQTRNTSPGTA